jgi:hypothetical protein
LAGYILLIGAHERESSSDIAAGMAYQEREGIYTSHAISLNDVGGSAGIAATCRVPCDFHLATGKRLNAVDRNWMSHPTHSGLVIILLLLSFIETVSMTTAGWANNKNK